MKNKYDLKEVKIKVRKPEVIMVGKERSYEYIEETVKAFVFGDIEKNEFMLQQDEIMRLADKYSVFFNGLVDSNIIEDTSYFSGKRYLRKDEWEEYSEDDKSHYALYNKVIRFCATYKVSIEGKAYFGSGSAGADNIADWRYKSYAYEIAHKRAKVNAVRAALGILNYEVNFEDKQEEEKQEEKDINLNKRSNKLITDRQLDGLKLIIKRRFPKILEIEDQDEAAKEFFNLFQVENIVSWDDIEKRSGKDYKGSLMKLITHDEAQKILNELGDFSSETKRL